MGDRTLRILEKISKILPFYAMLPLVSCWIWNTIVYNGVRLVNDGRIHYDMTTAFDAATPVIPAWVIIYYGCFLSWVVFYIACARVSKEHCAKFVTFDLLSRTVCGVIFLILPTFNIRPVIENNDIFCYILNGLYTIDAADNLFPSIHCLVSWNCFIGIRSAKCYSTKFKVITCIIAILVFASTLFTKQHVIADVISAVIISEGCWWIVNHTRIYVRGWNFFRRLNENIGNWYSRKRDAR
jgi:membrane-associated phospholipid phosphatase